VVVWQDFWLANPWDGPIPNDNDLFMSNVKDLILKIRNHASIGLYCGRNEWLSAGAARRGHPQRPGRTPSWHPLHSAARPTTL
jgi:hypothetical protein